MKMQMGLQLKLQQQLRLAPQIIQSIEILQLPVQELQELVAKELEENPTLEETPEQDESAPAEPSAESSTEAEAPAADGEQEYERVDSLENELREYDTYAQNSSTRRASGGLDSEAKMEAMNNTAARPISLQEHLQQQFHMLNPTPLMREIGEAIIFNLDNGGYLQYSLEEIAEAMDAPVVLEDVEKALAIIQSHEPPGVAARDLRECLLLQIDVGGGHQYPRTIVADHLDDLLENRIPKVARDTGSSIEDVNDALDFIRTLNPHPGNLFGGTPSGYIVPDVMVDYLDGEYLIRMERGYVPQLQINPLYRRILEGGEGDAELKEYVRKKLESAKWLIGSIEQRRNTVYRIAEKIVEIQKEFLDKGIQYLKPLKMQSVADEIGVHVSTVSRAIANKYIQTRRGIFGMKYFFTGATASGNGQVESRTSVRQRVLDVIDGEDKTAPLSDEEIAESLKVQNLTVARRTVTKYRKAMGIPSSRQRKKYE